MDVCATAKRSYHNFTAILPSIVASHRQGECFVDNVRVDTHSIHVQADLHSGGEVQSGIHLFDIPSMNSEGHFLVDGRAVRCRCFAVPKERMSRGKVSKNLDGVYSYHAEDRSSIPATHAMRCAGSSSDKETFQRIHDRTLSAIPRSTLASELWKTFALRSGNTISPPKSSLGSVDEIASQIAACVGSQATESFSSDSNIDDDPHSALAYEVLTPGRLLTIIFQSTWRDHWRGFVQGEHGSTCHHMMRDLEAGIMGMEGSADQIVFTPAPKHMGALMGFVCPLTTTTEQSERTVSARASIASGARVSEVVCSRRTSEFVKGALGTNGVGQGTVVIMNDRPFAHTKDPCTAIEKIRRARATSSRPDVRELGVSWRVGHPVRVRSGPGRLMRKLRCLVNDADVWVDAHEVHTSCVLFDGQNADTCTHMECDACMPFSRRFSQTPFADIAGVYHDDTPSLDDGSGAVERPIVCMQGPDRKGTTVMVCVSRSTSGHNMVINRQSLLRGLFWGRAPTALASRNAFLGTVDATIPAEDMPTAPDGTTADLVIASGDTEAKIWPEGETSTLVCLGSREVPRCEPFSKRAPVQAHSQCLPLFVMPIYDNPSDPCFESSDLEDATYMMLARGLALSCSEMSESTKHSIEQLAIGFETVA